ncbi:hypothetical protein L1987_72936 [Smallanthus sonchifolius]|uniref:Uncharacterized protein n=1 Tax=Smallanthus sonchifolius TaxID=185202 RepID=A0ACB9AXF6_9ASTR|nr:hypothetical protein L1987_72936 [Smallanthus sonchifolius]
MVRGSRSVVKEWGRRLALNLLWRRIREHVLAGEEKEDGSILSCYGSRCSYPFSPGIYIYSLTSLLHHLEFFVSKTSNIRF